MSGPDLHLFDGYEERLAALPKPRWCKCGHIEGTHWNDLHEELDVFFREGGNKVLERPVKQKCRRDDCKCVEFRPKKRRNRIKFFFTGRG